MTDSDQYCLILPHYNHVREFEEFLPHLLSLGWPCIVVDDGSDSDQCKKLEALLAGQPHCYLVKHETNRGKGAAVITAVYDARTLGMTHVFQIDADGQHNHQDINRFIDISRAEPDTIICGKPVFDETAPKARLYGRKVTDFWVALETLSLKIKDGLCGFRIYPISAFEQVLDAYYLGPRMDFDTEILVKSVWADVPLKFVETHVRYLENGASHFHYLRDNLNLIRLHTRLMAGMLVRVPQLIYQRFKSS